MTSQDKPLALEGPKSPAQPQVATAEAAAASAAAQEAPAAPAAAPIKQQPPAPKVGADGSDDEDMDGASAPATPGRDADADWAAGVSDDEADDEATLEEEEVRMREFAGVAWNPELQMRF